MSVDIQNCVPATPTPLEKVREKAAKVGAWIWEHKKWVVLAVATTTGVILLDKEAHGYKRLFPIPSHRKIDRQICCKRDSRGKRAIHPL